MSGLVGIVAAVYGLAMIVAAWSKLDSWRIWKRTTNEWFARGRRAKAVRYSVPAAEIAAGFAAVLAPTVGMVAVAFLLFVFAAGIYQLARSHHGEPCNCFGALAPSSLGRGLALRDLIAGVAAILVAVAAWQSGTKAVAVDTLVLLSLIAVLTMAGAEYAQMRRRALERHAAIGGE